MRRCILPAAAVLLLAPPGRAADLDRIDRKIVREPAYQSKAPRYCLLAFGLQAKTRVWLVQDGETLYVDRDGDGNLTGPGKRFEPAKQGDLRVYQVGDLKVGGLTHTGLAVMRAKATRAMVRDDREWQRVKKAGPEPWLWSMTLTAQRGAEDKRDLPRRIAYTVAGDVTGELVFAERAQDAPVVHFNGPFTLALLDPGQQLTPGRKAMLLVGVGTRGVGPGTFASVQYSNTIPAVHPRAEITFPARSPKGPPLLRTFTLTEHC
jgi:hypothetical protein